MHPYIYAAAANQKQIIIDVLFSVNNFYEYCT